MGMLTKIISGGQTGADQGGLKAAEWLGIPTGGWAPKGWRTEAGPAPWLGTDFGLLEHTSASYPPRTEQNILDSDGTIIFSRMRLERGSLLTWELCRKHHKNWHVVPFRDRPSERHLLIANMRGWLSHVNIKVLNVAGNRESKSPGIERFVIDFLVEALKK